MNKCCIVYCNENLMFLLISELIKKCLSLSHIKFAAQFEFLEDKYFKICNEIEWA